MKLWYKFWNRFSVLRVVLIEICVENKKDFVLESREELIDGWWKSWKKTDDNCVGKSWLFNDLLMIESNRGV